MSDGNEVVRALLEYSRQRISAGDRDNALASLIQAISLTRGENAIIEVLSQARDNAAQHQRRSMDPREVRRREREEQEAVIQEALQTCELLMNAESMLSERGDGSEEILRDAFEDGSSVVCRLCGGLVKRLRWEAHKTLWCPSITPTDGQANDVDLTMDEED